jgi:hypothetical protein
MADDSKISFKNVVCEPKDIFQDIKRQILEFISLNQTVCNNLPDLSVPNLIPNTNLNPSQKVIDLLLDILALVSGINFEEMRMQVINWLVEQLQPLSEDLSVKMVELIKSCYACKIEPVIPDWLFQIQPSSIQYDNTGSPIPNSGIEGVGLNIELSKIDLTCIFAADPNTEVGKLFYDGDSSNDITAFLWEVIQLNGDPLIWSDPTNGKQIFEVRYFEDSPIAFTKNDGTVNYQNIEPRPRVFNIKLINSTYQNSSIITFLVDYFNSQQPLFDVDKVVPNVIDILYGTLTNKIDLPDECLNKVVQTEQAIDDYIENGVDNFEITFDESFYTFDTKQLANIKERVKQKKTGVRQYRDCCGKEVSSISFETVSEITNNLKNSSTLQSKINTYTESIDKLIDESTSNIKSSSIDLKSASAEFFANFITSLQIALSKLVLSPKNLMMLNLFYYLVNGKPVEAEGVKAQLREYECIIRCLIADFLRRLIYEFLLPMVIKTLKNLIICAITKKIKEKHINYFKSKLSLLPGFINEQLETVNELFGKGESLVDQARGFTDKINLDSLNNINLQFNKKNRFCE